VCAVVAVSVSSLLSELKLLHLTVSRDNLRGQFQMTQHRHPPIQNKYNKIHHLFYKICVTNASKNSVNARRLLTEGLAPSLPSPDLSA
jgi:hypothetical protein